MMLSKRFEVVDAWHNGINTGTVPMKLVVFYAGVQHQALTVTEASASGAQ